MGDIFLATNVKTALFNADLKYLTRLLPLSIDHPKPPQGKVEFLELSGKCIKMKWKAPRDNGGKQVTGFVIERRIAGKKSWTRVGEVDSSTTVFSDDKVEEGQGYQYRIRAVNAEGMSDPLETEEVCAGEPIGKSSFEHITGLSSSSSRLSSRSSLKTSRYMCKRKMRLVSSLSTSLSLSSQRLKGSFHH